MPLGLLPRRSFPNEVYTPRLDAFVELKRRWKVAIQAMVYRCKDLGIFDEDQITNLYKQISYRKWRTKEPLDDPKLLPLEQPTLLNRAVTLVLESGPARFRGRIRAFIEGIVVYAGMSAAGVLLLLFPGADPLILCGVGAAAALLYLGANWQVRGSRQMQESRTGPGF